MKTPSLIPAALAALLLAGPLAATRLAATPVDVRGVHTDLRVSRDEEADALALHWHTDTAYLPADAFASILPTQTVVRPAGAQWDFLGIAAGETYWRGYRNEEPDHLYLGFDVQLPAPATFSLLDVEGPGHVSVWGTTSTVYWASADPARASFVLGSGTHLHTNWGFTREGTYILTIGVEAVIEGITEHTAADFRFVVGNAIPEPATASALLGLVALAAARLRRPRRPTHA